MTAVRTLTVPGGVRSLLWDGDDLLDLVGGGRRWAPDGTERGSLLHWGFPFDRAALSPSGRYAAVWTERGTKGLLLETEELRVLREVNRSYYCAEDYDYPLALGRLPDGREVVVHCPEEYNELQVEDLVTGERLTTGPREPVDAFHSRPEVSPDGRHLLVAGWVWTPVGTARVHDLAAALTDPAALDTETLFEPHSGIAGEVGAACWLDAQRIAVSTTDDPDGPGAQLGPLHLGVWSVPERRWLHLSPLDAPTGALLARGGQVVALHGHPRLLDAATGTVLAEWPELELPRKDRAYGVTHVPSPVAALSPDGTRLAVARPDAIAVVDLPAAV
ncbi:hypothetical protein Kpho01_56250 [Kitasatospora phosalacinea]|uniref:Uncharacterized protein n=1 Tax=Kitasatospora phosalacinea TaxID=2065 RepID=A0A9W6UQV9_9ACTN|nr:hypothetical protein Kpho01_56250 [Kitasatospora phosalacinea]